MADQWLKGSPDGGDDAADIDTLVQANNNSLDRLLAKYRQGCTVRYGSAATVVVAVGSVTCSNADASVRKFRQNTAEVTVTMPDDLDTGSEANSTTYYVWAVADADATTFTCKLSTSSTVPTGCTYYLKLGSFTNNASGNIERVIDDQNSTAMFGAWASKSNSTVYQADTDGFVISQHSSGAGFLAGYTDSSNPPTTGRWSEYQDASNVQHSMMMPVRKGDYWKVTGANTVYWLPVGAA